MSARTLHVPTPQGHHYAAQRDGQLTAGRRPAGQLTEDIPAIVAIKGMRAACRCFLDQPHPSFLHLERNRLSHDSGFFVALGELRAAVGLHLVTLIMAYDLEIEEELASILPLDSETEERE